MSAEPLDAYFFPGALPVEEALPAGSLPGPDEALPEQHPLPDWFYPAPPGGWTADDLDRLPPVAPRHIELIDGALIPLNPQTKFHVRVITRLTVALDAAAPEGLEATREMTVTLGNRQRPEPDVLVVRDDTPEDLHRTSYQPHEVLLAVEVVSDDSEERDRGVKPQRYSEAGIRHFWRIEEEDGEPVVYVYELDRQTKEYVPTGIYRQRLTLTTPFPIDIELAALT